MLFEEEHCYAVAEGKQIVVEGLKVGENVEVKYGKQQYPAIIEAEGKHACRYSTVALVCFLSGVWPELSSLSFSLQGSKEEVEAI